jgi:hypothetical protein
MKNWIFMAYFAAGTQFHSPLKKFFFPILYFIFFSLPALFAQVKEPGTNVNTPSASGIKFSGFVDCDIFFDSRQTVMSREGQWLFYPENVKTDAEGVDINAKGTYNILSIQTRVTGNISGPAIWGAQSSALIEGEFYGNINPNINTFRLRHAWIKLNWPKTELLTGQYWHPMYPVNCAPEVVSLNAGAPFIIFTRNPQVRLTQQAGNFKFIAAALAQLDAPSTGPDGPSPKYMRNSMIPEVCLQVQLEKKPGKNRVDYMIGASMSYLILTPRLSTAVTVKPAFDSINNNIVTHYDAVVSNFSTHETTHAVTFNFFSKLRLPLFTFKLGGVYAQNSFAYNMIGGYVEKSLTDSLKGSVDYTPVKTGTLWSEIKTNGNRWQTGIYGGFCKNFGTGTQVSGPYYSRGQNIDYLYRIAPRIICMVNKFRVAGELDYTVAAYGTTNDKGMVSGSREVANIRLLCSILYYF